MCFAFIAQMRSRSQNKPQKSLECRSNINSIILSCTRYVGVRFSRKPKIGRETVWVNIKPVVLLVGFPVGTPNLVSFKLRRPVFALAKNFAVVLVSVLYFTLHVDLIAVVVQSARGFGSAGVWVYPPR